MTPIQQDSDEDSPSPERVTERILTMERKYFKKEVNQGDKMVIERNTEVMTLNAHQRPRFCHHSNGPSNYYIKDNLPH